MARVALAYSGGVDTSVAIRWLKEERGLDVIACAVDVGQGGDAESLKARARGAGAVDAYVIDARERFAREYLFTALKANALYENGYTLQSALSRPIIAEEVICVAKENDCEWFSHGCTGKGNDQARFESAVAALAPELKVIAPVREWEFRTREEEIDYAAKHNIPVPVKKESPYSLDENMWGVAIECGVLEDPWCEPPEDAYIMTVSPQNAPDKPTDIEIAFEAGEPVSLDGRRMDPVDLLAELNEVGGRNGVGRLDLVENRLVGIKSREIYEAPGATILISAHKALEDLVISRDVMHLKEELSLVFGRLIYEGLWFSDLRESLQAFVDSTQRYVTGTLKMRLYKGNCSVAGRKSDYSLYDKKLATYGEGDVFDHTAAKGFLQIRNLTLRAEGQRRQKEQNRG